MLLALEIFNKGFGEETYYISENKVGLVHKANKTGYGLSNITIKVEKGGITIDRLNSEEGAICIDNDMIR